MAETDGEQRDGADNRASPAQISNPELRLEAQRAVVGVVVVGFTLLAVYISQALLVIFGAMVFASMLDGGTRLLGRWVPLGRAWRLGIVLLGIVGFFAWLGYFAGSQITREAAELPEIVEQQ